MVEVLKRSEESPTLKNLLLCNDEFTSKVIEFSNESRLFGFKWRSSIMEKSHNFTHTFERNIDYPLQKPPSFPSTRASKGWAENIAPNTINIPKPTITRDWSGSLVSWNE